MKKKTGKVLMSLLCAAAILTSGAAMKADAAPGSIAPEAIRIYGTVSQHSSDRITLIRQDGDMAGQDLVITVSDHTRVLSAVTGFPSDINSLQEGDTIYAYIGPAMTLSLPPMANASMVLTDIPADYKVPEYVKSSSLTINKDKVSGSMTGTNGVIYTIPSGCQILPYLTRNIVTIHDLTPDRTCLIWTESNSNTAAKIVVFPPTGEDSSDVQPSHNTGWVQDGTCWYYYNEDGTLHKGWLSDQGSWYYLDQETGVMKTGFLTVEGKTYYFYSDGKMLTKAKTFTPDESGALQ